jgi:methionine-rich copper-binding protein CopC
MIDIRKIRSKLFAVLLLTVLSLSTVYAHQPIISSKKQDNKATIELKIIDKIIQLPEVKVLKDDVIKS